MRILFLSEYFHPHWTGLAKSILKTAIVLQQKGHTCAVLTTRYDKTLSTYEVYKELPIYRCSPLFNVSRTKYSLSVIFKFANMAKNYDLVFINCPNSNVLPFTAIAKLLGKKVLIFLNGDLILPSGLGNRMVEKIFDASMLASCRLADVVSTYTEDYAQHSRILSKFMHKFKTLLLPVTSYEKKSSKRIDILMKKIRSEKKAKLLVGFAGRFVEEKGFDILLSAIPSIIKLHPDTHFVYAGSETIAYEKFFEEHKEKWNAVDSHITKTGLLEGEAEMNAFYENLDLIVLPSRSDCFPNVQVEAIEHGVPIVVSDIPGARWPVKESGFGKITEPESTDSLSDSIIYCLMNKEQLKDRRNSAQRLLDGSIFFEQFQNITKELQIK